MVKQSVDTTFGDIRRRELLAEHGLQVTEVQCSTPVMWITPSQRICQGSPVTITISHDLRPITASSVIPAGGDAPRAVGTFTPCFMCRDPTAYRKFQEECPSLESRLRFGGPCGKRCVMVHLSRL